MLISPALISPPFVIIADDGDVTDLKENIRINNFTNRGKFFGDCIIIKAFPDYKSRSDYSGMACMSKEEINYIIDSIKEHKI